MAQTFGHVEFSIGSFKAGEFRVAQLEAPEALGPRLAVTVECVLHDVPAGRYSEEPVEGYRLIGMIGELQLTQEQQPVALLHWLGGGHWVRSQDYHHATSLHLVAELDPARVERLASVAGDHGLEIPTRKWAELASRWRGFTHEVILLSYSEAFAEQFRTALTHVRKAQDLVDEARFSEAVATCRKALERLAIETQKRLGEEGVEVGLQSLVGPKKAEAYAGFLAKLKEVGNLVLCSQSLFRFADLGDDGLCRGGPDKGCGVIVSAIDVVVDRLD